jgi:hypothetical protein
MIFPGYYSRFDICPPVTGALLPQQTYVFFKILRGRIVRKNKRRQK